MHKAYQFSFNIEKYLIFFKNTQIGHLVTARTTKASQILGSEMKWLN